MAGASYEVRLAVGRGRSIVQVSAKDLIITDADVGDVLVESSEPVVLRWSPLGLSLKGASVHPGAVLIRAKSAIVVEGRSLIGEVEICRETHGLLIINRLSLERYLRGVIGAEMGPNWPIEALKAQAVAARTFFLHKRLDREDASYDVSSTTLDQVYRGIVLESAKTKRAVETTRGLVLTWGNMPAETLYHACCGGRTHASIEVFGGKVPYLRAFDDPDCSQCPKNRWRVRLTLAEVSKKLACRGWRGDIDRVMVQSEFLVFEGQHGRDLKVSFLDFRKLIGAVEIPSPWFRASVQQKVLELDGRGSGHGVGMCQWGARGMAEKGENFRSILKRYYPGCKLRKLF